jgi:ribosome-binding protein aMBF1 (putative translation factor)
LDNIINDGDDYQFARDVLGMVAAWYSSAIMEQRRAGASDADLAEMISRRRAYVEEQDRIDSLPPHEARARGMFYRAMLENLK